ncbi:hypothetical protein ACJIZ3_016166 [Penstemon smallii]|uniref:Cytochrome P450 n=1 Tax=Penstemon smallii TaxID=265156 RepID=A0ABD3RPU3_9LAMI
MDVYFAFLSIIATTLLLMFMLFSALMLRIFTGKSIRNPDYPPVMGTVFSQLFYFNRLYDYQIGMAKKHKTFRLLAPDQSEIYTTEPRNIEHILKRNFSKYSKGKYNQDVMKDLFGQGIFVVDGEKWIQQRKLASVEFSSGVLRDFSSSEFRKNSAKLVRTIFEFSKQNQVFDIQALLMRCTLDSIFKVGFGVDLNCLEGSNREGDEFIKAFDDSNELLYWRYVDPFWKLKRYLNIGAEAKLKKNIKITHNFVDKVIKTKKERMEMEKHFDILSRFLAEGKKYPETMSDIYLRDIILNFIIAGKDTTANTLSWFIYVLCRNPLIQEKIAQELGEVVNCPLNEANVSNFIQSVTDGALEQMHFLHATLTETLRLYPAVPVDGRCSETDDTLPDGYKLKKGDDVYYLAYAMGRMPYIWGEDADEFRPERWLKNGVFQPESPFKFVAFHGGPRICLGKDFAYRQMKIVSAALVHFFSSTSITFLFIFFSIFFVNLLVRKLHEKKKKYHPIGGTVLHQLKNFNRLHDYMTDLAEKYKTYRLIGLFRSEVYTSDPANVEYILKSNFENYGKGEYNYTILKDLLGDGIFTVDGDKWKEQRKVASHEFSRRALRDFSAGVFRNNAVKLANIVSESVITNEPIDIQDLFMKSTLDSISKVAFGVELDSLCGSNDESEKFSKAFDDASAMTAWRYVDVLWKIKKALNLGLEAKLKKNIEVGSLNNKEDMVSRFLQLNGSDPKYVRDIILNFVMAGKDTTATTLSWFIYMLCKHPLVQEKVAQEIEEATKGVEANSISEFASSVSEEALEKMHYLHATLTETLRLYPPVPVNPKICMSDDKMRDGFHVRKGDTVAYQPYAMGRMRFIWGDDAQKFRPERWLDKNGCFRPENPFKFTAFQAGPRICLGKEFAYGQMKIVTAVLCRSFIFRLSDDKRAVKYRTMINLHIDGGLSVRAFHRRH